MTAAAPASSAWADAMASAALFAIDPVGLGGVVVRSRPGQARDRWTQMMRALLPTGAPVRRIPSHIEDERLLGGLDLAATLAAGRPIVQRGLLAECDGGVALLTMAERMDAAGAARLAAVLDRGEVAIERDGLAARLPARIGLVAFDEGLAADETPPESLRERLAFHLLLDSVAASEIIDGPDDVAAIASARGRLAAVETADAGVIEALCTVSDLFGLRSPRAPILALRAARAHAALRRRPTIAAEDAAVAVRLVLAPRAVAAPAQTEAQADETPAEPPPEPRPDDAEETAASAMETSSETEMVIAAISATLPDDLLARLSGQNGGPVRAGKARGSGAPARAAARGRPVGSRQGALRSGDRLNLVETLRAAAPWQRLRGAGLGRIEVRSQDFRIRRFVQDREATIIFAVDASGSAALHRLSEAKGAVELLLAKAYVSRSRVALIAFRGQGAELLLPATRSLTRAKRQLADLPGGGATPLAAGIDATVALAEAEKAKQRTPLMVLLTDGRANIGADGAPGRVAAVADAMASARRVREAGIGAVVVDTSPRPQPGGDQLARAMGALYAPLPYLDAGAMVGLLGDLQGTRGPARAPGERA